MAQKSVEALFDFDADPNTIVLIAHDPTSLDVFDFFPAKINDWKQKNQKKKAFWGFLSEIPYNGKVVREQLVDGLYDQKGNKLRGLET